MRTLLCVVAAVLLTAGPAAAEIYKWTDENGRVHYGDRNVQGAEKIRIKTRQTEKDDDEEDEETVAGSPDAAKCEEAKKKLVNYESAARLMQRKADGTEVAISDDERAALIASQRGTVEHYCGSGS